MQSFHARFESSGLRPRPPEPWLFPSCYPDELRIYGLWCSKVSWYEEADWCISNGPLHVCQDPVIKLLLLKLFRGGKVAMALALAPSPPSLSNLIISDIAPTQTSLSPSFVRYLDIMSHIENPATDVRTREHAGKILETVEQVCTIYLTKYSTKFVLLIRTLEFDNSCSRTWSFRRTLILPAKPWNFRSQYLSLRTRFPLLALSPIMKDLAGMAKH